MFSEKTTTTILAFLFLIPFVVLIFLFSNIYNVKQCEKFGKIYNFKIEKRFFSSCKYQENGEWKDKKNFILPIPEKKLSTVYPQGGLDNFSDDFYNQSFSGR
jgi:hypothetical protein